MRGAAKSPSNAAFLDCDVSKQGGYGSYGCKSGRKNEEQPLSSL